MFSQWNFCYKSIWSIAKAFKNDCLSISTVFDCYKKFKDGTEYVKNDPWSGRLSISINDQEIHKVRELILWDCQSITRKIIEEVPVLFGFCQANSWVLHHANVFFSHCGYYLSFVNQTFNKYGPTRIIFSQYSTVWLFIFTTIKIGSSKKLPLHFQFFNLIKENLLGTLKGIHMPWWLEKTLIEVHWSWRRVLWRWNKLIPFVLCYYSEYFLITGVYIY